jgi:hypothetical protein
MRAMLSQCNKQSGNPGKGIAEAPTTQLAERRGNVCKSRILRAKKTLAETSEGRIGVTIT